MLSDIFAGLLLCLRWDVLGMIGIGTVLGVVVGALPGLTATMAVAILLPISFFMPAIMGIPFLIAITKGAIYGGSIPAILINAPGTGAAAATVLDGYPLSQQGKSRKALEMALYASVTGDSISDLITLCGIGILAYLALMVGPPEYFSIILLSFMLIAVMTSGSIIRGLIAAFAGFFLSTIGIDPLSYSERYTFGNLDLSAGVSIVPMIIGLFAVAEILRQSEKKIHPKESGEWSSQLSEKSISAKGEALKLRELKESAKTIIKSAFIGTGIGNIPGIGQVVAAFVCYGIAKGSSKHPEKFGKGALEGIAAAESGNNAVNGSSLMPLLVFGIPGDTITAVLLAAFMVQGLRPGPSLFESQGPIVYSILWALLLSNLILLALGYLAIRYIALIARIPKSVLFPAVASLCFVGAYSVDNSMFDVFVAVFFGAFGYLMQKFKFPIPPLLLTFILGPLFETSLGQSLIMSDGSPIIFLHRPISLLFLILTPITLIYLLKRLPKVH